MISVSFAPEIGAVELVVLSTLTTPGELFQSAFIRAEIRKYEPFQEYCRKRFHVIMKRLAEQGLVSKVVARDSQRAVGFKITSAGVEYRNSSINFFKSL